MIYRSTVRAMGDRTLMGIIIPFNVRDKYGTYWDAKSDLMLSAFRTRPVFWWHLDAKREAEHNWKRAGYLLDDAFEVREEGLYAYAKLENNGTADMMYQRALAGDLAWSTGAMPNLVTIRDDGYVSRWGFVEVSGAPVDNVVSQRGTTTAYAVSTSDVVRSVMGEQVAQFDKEHPLLPNSGSQNDFQITRGLIIMQDETKVAQNGAGLPSEAEGKPGNTSNSSSTNTDGMAQILAAMNDMRGELQQLRAKVDEEKPAKQVGAVDLPAGDNPKNPRVEVFYKWDEASLFASALRLRAFPETRKDTQFVKSVVAKMKDARDAVDNSRRTDVVVPDGDRMALRAEPVDDAAYKAWSARVPNLEYLRANEAMQVDSNLVDTLLESVAWYTFRMNTRVMQTLPSFVMTEPTVTRTIIGSGPTVRLVSELADQDQASVANSPIPTSKITTSQVTWNTNKVGALTIASEEVFEESSVAMLEVWAQQYARSFADAMDSMLLNGDERTTIANISHYNTTGTDTLVGTTSDAWLALDGLRQMAHTGTSRLYDFASGGDSVSTDGTIVSADLTHMRRMLGTRGALGTDLSNIVAFVDMDVYYLMSLLDDYKSASDVNNLSTLLSGTLDVVRGIPLIPTAQLPLVTAGGQIHQTGGNNTKASFLLLHRPSFIVGLFRSLMTEVTRIPHSESRAISATVRFDVQNWQDNALAYGHGIDV